MTQSEFEFLSGFEPTNFENFNWAYMLVDEDKQDFVAALRDITGNNESHFIALEAFLENLKEAFEDELNDLRIQHGKAEKRANALGELAYTWSQADEEHINEVAELYGKDAYCVRAITEGGELTENLKKYVTDKILND